MSGNNNNDAPDYVDWRNEANKSIMAVATRAIARQYMEARTGSINRLYVNRAFEELAGEIGQFMGFGRHRATIVNQTIVVEFERGGLSATAPATKPYDTNVDMAYLIWVESFMAMVGMTRSEFVEVKSFMYRGFSKEELEEIRRRGRTGCDEQVALAREEERQEAKRAAEQEAQTRRERAEWKASKDELLEYSRRLNRANDQLDRANEALEQLRRANDQQRLEVEQLLREAVEQRGKKLADDRKHGAEVTSLKNKLDKLEKEKLELKKELDSNELKKAKPRTSEPEGAESDKEKSERAEENRDEVVEYDEQKDEEAKRDEKEREDQDPPKSPADSA